MLRLRVQQYQHLSKIGLPTYPAIGTPVVVTCTGNIASWTAGSNTGWGSTWEDITEDVMGLDSLELSMESESTTGTEQYKVKNKTGGSQITIINESADRVKAWIFDPLNPCYILNYWIAEIYDTDCDYLYQNFEIKPENIETCDEDVCLIEVPLKEVDNKKRVLESIPITDDWQGWFNGFNGQTKRDFPTHEFVIHNTPMQHGMIVGLWVFVKTFATVPGTPIGVGGLVSAIIGNVDESAIKGLGFGNFHPVIPIRDFLENTIKKLFPTTWVLDTPFDVGNELEFDHYCFVKSGDYHTIYTGTCTAPATKFIWNNRDLHQMSEFLDEICEHYNAKWSIEDSTLKIEFLKDIVSQAPVATIPDEDISKFCKTQSTKKRAGMGEYRHNLDAGDQKSNTMSVVYDDIVDYDGVTENALYEGSNKKRVKFGATSFWGDGFGNDMLNDILDMALIVTVVLSALGCFMLISMGTGFILPIVGLATNIASIVYGGIVLGLGILGVVGAVTEINNYRSDFGYSSCHKGSVHLFGTGQMNERRIIRLQDGLPIDNPRPVETAAGSIVVAPRYDVPTGSTTAWNTQFNGGYGSKSIAFNYPLVFDAKYLGNLYDNYHEQTDSALFVASTNEEIEMEIPLCCEYLDIIGINSDTANIIGKVIEAKGKKILVSSVRVNYKDLKIKIKGKVIL